MQCPDCQLENEEGALYCARCHRPMPRKPAPGECPHCGRMPEPGELPPAVCPSCGGDPERGKEMKEKRLAALRAEVALQAQTLEAQRQALAAKKGKKGCGLTLLVLVMGVTLFGRSPYPHEARASARPLYQEQERGDYSAVNSVPFHSFQSGRVQQSHEFASPPSPKLGRRGSGG